MAILEKIKENLPDTFRYKGKHFRMIYYSKDVFPTKKYPTRSKEIIWEAKDGSQVYLNGNKISYS